MKYGNPHGKDDDSMLGAIKKKRGLAIRIMLEPEGEQTPEMEEDSLAADMMKKQYVNNGMERVGLK